MQHRPHDGRCRNETKTADLETGRLPSPRQWSKRRFVLRTPRQVSAAADVSSAWCPTLTTVARPGYEDTDSNTTIATVSSNTCCLVTAKTSCWFIAVMEGYLTDQLLLCSASGAPFRLSGRQFDSWEHGTRSPLVPGDQRDGHSQQLQSEQTCGHSLSGSVTSASPSPANPGAHARGASLRAVCSFVASQAASSG